MFDFKYDVARNNGKVHSPNFLNIKIVDKGSNVFLITGRNGSGKSAALRMIEYALREPIIDVPAQLRLTSLDGTRAIKSYIDPRTYSSLNGKRSDSMCCPDQFKVIRINLGDTMDGIDMLFKGKSDSVGLRFERFIRKVDTINSGNGVLLLDDINYIGKDGLNKLIKNLKNLVEKGRLMAVIIATLGD
jgi:hypothetical protein